MGYTIPPAKVPGDAWTAALWNTYVKDNLIELEKRTAWVSAFQGAVQSTSSTTFTDLATVGPTVNLTVGGSGRILLVIECAVLNNSTNESFMGFAMSGANVAASTSTEAYSSATGWAVRASYVLPVNGLNAGSTTITAKYRCVAGTATYADRRLAAVAL